MDCADKGWKISAGQAKKCLPDQKWFNNLRLNIDAREEVTYAPHENEEEPADYLTDIVHVADRNLDGTLNLAE